MVAGAPSHRTTFTPEGRVIIHDLEFFVGHIPDLDGEDFKKWDDEKIDEAFRATSARIQAGQRPKLILGHNSKDRSPDMPAPSYGDILTLKKARINGGPGLKGDVEMAAEDFERLIASNHYPRRSAEIWSDGVMSEVALIGSETPARPLPDTRFGRDDDRGDLVRELFTRDAPELRMENVMPDDKTKIKNTDGGPSDDDDLREENRKLKAELAKLRKSVKAQADGPDDDDDKKEDNRREQFRREAVLEAERDSWKEKFSAADERLSAVETTLKKEQYGRDLDALKHAGYAVGKDGSDERKVLLDRVCASTDPAAELEFIKTFVRKDPLEQEPVGHQFTRTEDGDTRVDVGDLSAKAEQYCKTLQARLAGEGKDLPKGTFTRVYEALADGKDPDEIAA